MLNHLQFYYYTLIGCKTIPTWRLFIGFSCVDNPPDWCTSSLIHVNMFSGLGWRMEITMLSKHIQTFSGKPIYKQLNPKCWSYKPSKPSWYLIVIFLEVSLYHPHPKPHSPMVKSARLSSPRLQKLSTGVWHSKNPLPRQLPKHKNNTWWFPKMMVPQ